MKRTKILVLLALVALLFSCAPEVTVTFSANGGKGTMDDVVAKKGATIHLPGNGFFSRIGYAFVGWNLDPNGSGSTYAAGAAFTITGDVPFYAVWVQIFHTVTFDANGGSGTMEVQTIGQGLTVALTANSFSKTDYIFAGWSTSATGTVEYSDEANYTMGSRDVTLYAIWERITHTVTFNANGGTGNDYTQKIGQNSSASLTANGFIRTNYAFTGWSTTAGGAVEYSDEANYTMGSSDVTLYAVWGQIFHTVTFNANGGSGTMAAQTIWQGSTVALTANGFTKTDSIFTGWSTSTTGMVEYSDEANYTMGSSDVTLYAIWENFDKYLKMVEVPVPTGGITFPSVEDDSETTAVAKPFCAAETEVTWALWNTVSQWNSDNSKGYDFKGAGQMGGWKTSVYSSNPCNANHPVTMVSWRDAIVFCNALTQWVNETQSPATPLMPVYYSDATYTQPIKVTDKGESVHPNNAGDIDKPYIKADTNWNTDMANCSANGFRLPTSVEWECVARWQGKTNLNDNFVNPLPSACTAGYYWTKGNSASGSTTASKGSDTRNVAVYDDNLSNKTAAVKSKRANGLGLYDVSGNAWEWSFDWHPDSIRRVLCGGGWLSMHLGLQVGYVGSSSPSCRHPSSRNHFYGLRVFQSQ